MTLNFVLTLVVCKLNHRYQSSPARHYKIVGSVTSKNETIHVYHSEHFCQFLQLCPLIVFIGILKIKHECILTSLSSLSTIWVNSPISIRCVFCKKLREILCPDLGQAKFSHSAHYRHIFASVTMHIRGTERTKYAHQQ